MTEIWRPIADYEGLYEVSNLGRVKSLKRQTRAGQWVHERVLKVLHASNQYQQVCLWKNGKSKRVLVHRLVAQAFLGPCPLGCVVCHGAAGKHVNSVDNLSYGTRSKNNKQDKLRDGTLIRGESHYRAVMTEDLVLHASALKRQGFTYAQLEKRLGIKRRTLRAALTGENWSHVLPG